MAPKKQQKMSLGDFLGDQSLGSWADEMDSQPLPAPGSGFGGERRGFGSGNTFGSDRAAGGGFGDRSALPDRMAGYAVREELPLPSKPPYTAHMGNLSFEVTDGDVQDFLSGCEVTNVRIVEDKMDRRPKGFGYVEFGTVDGLKKALNLSGTQFQGRNIRISVAEPPKERSEAREITEWTRKGPLAELPGQGMRRTSERQGSFRNADSASDAGSERGGSRRGGFFEGDGKVRDFNSWERKGPLSPPPASETRQGYGMQRTDSAPRERKQSPAWGEGQARGSDAGSRPPRREFSERAIPERAPTAADTDTQWRTKMKPDAPSPAATPDPSVPSSPAAPSAPSTRPRLNLAKRTVSEAPAPDAAASTESKGTDSKASPFGAARPIDTSARDREIEEKRQLAIKQKKEADDKIREEKKAKEAASKAERAASVADNKAQDAPSAPKENGKPTEKETEATSPAAGRQYEILRRDNNEDNEGEEDTDGVDAPANGDIVGDKETKPQEAVREINADGSVAADSSAADPTAKSLEDDGFVTVAGKNKKGRRAGQRDLAS